MGNDAIRDAEQALARGMKTRSEYRPEKRDIMQSSPIRTVTVGTGVSPVQSIRRECNEQNRGLCSHNAGIHRRWGLSPRPEDMSGMYIFFIERSIARHVVFRRDDENTKR